MKIIGFTITKVQAEKNSKHNGKVDIKSGLNIENISEEKLNISEKFFV